MKVVARRFNFLTGEITVREREIDVNEALKRNAVYQSLLRNKKRTSGGKTNRESDDAQ